MSKPLPNLEPAIQQLYPSLNLRECTQWLEWLSTQPDYYIATVGEATCISKVFDQVDPPWQRVAQEVCWWGHGRDAVRALQRGRDWARLQGAILYGYSIAPHYHTLRWKTL